MQAIERLLKAVSLAHPDSPILKWRDSQSTCGQLANAVGNAVRHLQDRGVAPQATVAFLFDNTPACVAYFLALACLNVCVIPVEPDASFPYCLEPISRDIAFSAVVGEASKIERVRRPSHANLVATIEDCRCENTTLEHLPGTEGTASESVFLYHYTSGSTGRPKAAIHSQSNLVRGGAIYARIYQLTPRDSILLCVPLVHSFGMVAGLMAALHSGARLILLERFIPSRVIEAISSEQANVLVGAPLVYDLVARCAPNQPSDIRTLRACLSSGGPLPLRAVQVFEGRWQKRIYQVYGSTEMGVIAAQWPGERDWPRSSVGVPVDGVQVRIVDENGNEVATGDSGDLLVKTSTMFSGYYNDSGTTAKAFSQGWYRTGDTARQDHECNLYLLGRKDTFINVGGKKVNPMEVEDVLMAHPMVAEVVVYARDVGDGVEEVCADVVLLGSCPVEDLVAFCRERLAPHKVPCLVQQVPMIRRAKLGKIERKSGDQVVSD